jgi:hypothetical protein
MYYIVKTAKGFFLSQLFSTQRYAEFEADQDGDKVYKLDLSDVGTSAFRAVDCNLVFVRKK